MQTLPKGICYKVLAEGKADGRHPGPRSIVTAHYTGWTIDGRQFDSSRGGAPLAIRLCDLIEGWIVAMQQMCVGVGGLHAGGNGLRQVFPAGHTGQFYAGV